MLSDSELFIQLCGNCNISAPPEVLERIKIGSTTGELKLSSMSIVVPVCGILGRVLASSSTIRKVDLGDCMLLSKGLSSILNALCEGSNVTSLNLKGNNINGPAVGQLGEIFQRNNTLKRLSLEWNGLGSDIEEFSKFCDALGTNHNIEELDLRYNQISPRAGESLAKALRTNKSLRIVDLAWNALGLRGGQLMLEAVRENRGLIKLNLRGNCIPEEMVYAIEEAIRRNESACLVSRVNLDESTSKLVQLHEGIKNSMPKLVSMEEMLREPKQMDLSTSPGTEPCDNQLQLDDNITRIVDVDRGRDVDAGVNRSIECQKVDPNIKIIELNQMLRDRSAAIELLTREMKARTAESETTVRLVQQLENEIKLLKTEREKFGEEKSREIADLREIREKSDDHWQREYKRLEESLRESACREKELEAKAQWYEREIRKLNSDVMCLREKSVSQTRSYEDLIAKSRVELHRARREVRERENRHKMETNLLKTSLKESTGALLDCQAQLQMCRLELREVGEKLTCFKTRQSELEKQNSRLLGIEECCEKLKDEKKIMDEKSLEYERNIAALQRQIAKLQGELIEPNRRYELVKDELVQEREKTARMKLELSEERARYQEQTSQIQALNGQINALNNQINEMQNNHIETIRELDKERQNLKDVISNKERDFNDLRTEEVQRANQLYAAFSKYYLGSIGSNVTL